MLRRLALVVCWCVLVALPSLALDRTAFNFPAYDLEIHIDPHQHWLAVEGTLELRNISGKPQTEAALQISSSLRWLSVQHDGAAMEWLAQSYTSDIDHTGMLSEAIVKFDRPLAPGQSLRLTVRYAGTVTRDATRLERIGTPRQVALRSDWDQIGDNFTALRGAGFVAWYPVSTEAASLSAGNELFEALRDWRERQASAVMRVKLRVEAQSRPSEPIAGSPGTPQEAQAEKARLTFVGNGAAIGQDSGGKEKETELDGSRTVLAQEFRGVEPVLVMLKDAASTTDRPNVAAYYTAAHTSLARDYMAAVEAVILPLEEWFQPQLGRSGKTAGIGKAQSKVVLVELADPETLPYQTGSYSFMPLRAATRAAAEVAMARVVAEAMLDSRRAWVRDGLAGFAQALIRERQGGRKAALDYLGQFGSTLAEAEAQSVGAAAKVNSASASADAPQPQQAKSGLAGEPPATRAQPLVVTADEIYLRTKAAYVWWMLRDMVGDVKLQAALAAYRAAEDRDTGYVQRLIEQQFSPRRDLEQFFDDWVYRDRGLPQLRIVSALARKTLGEQTVTAVTVENLGEAGCEVPVIVRGGGIEARASLLVPGKGKAIMRVPLAATPTEVEVNDGSVPESSRERHVMQVGGPASSIP